MYLGTPSSPADHADAGKCNYVCPMCAALGPKYHTLVHRHVIRESRLTCASTFATHQNVEHTVVFQLQVLRFNAHN